MQDADFLNQALKQAFLHPIVHSADGVFMADYTGLTGCFRFSDNRFRMLLSCPLPLNSIKKYLNLTSRAVNIRHNPRLYDECEIYKHDISENIVLPAAFSQDLHIKEELDLLEVNRQSAQKKKVVATIFPSEFMQKYQTLKDSYPADIKQAEEILLKNQKAYNLSLINDFAAVYKKVISGYNISDFILWINRKRLRYYLNEAAQLLKSNQIISVDFYETHPFHGENCSPVRRKIIQCRNNLKQLLFLLKKMVHEPVLLSMSQAVIAHNKNFAQMLSEYRDNNKCENASAVANIRHAMQDLFNKYVFLTYLNGVRFSFENKFLNEYPQKRHPPLPTVSPQDEVRKISKIVEESRKISAESGKLKQIYIQALKDYEDGRQKLMSAISKISGFIAQKD